MPFPSSSPVAGGDSALASHYNNLRNDALYPILQDFTYGETIAVKAALYLKASDQKVYKTDSTANDEKIQSFVGFAKEAGVLNDVKKVQVLGLVEGLSGLTIGAEYFLSTTPGAITDDITLPANKKSVGIAMSATTLLIRASPQNKLDIAFGFTNVAGTGGDTYNLVIGFIPRVILFFPSITMADINMAAGCGYAVGAGVDNNKCGRTEQYCFSSGTDINHLTNGRVTTWASTCVLTGYKMAGSAFAVNVAWVAFR